MKKNATPQRTVNISVMGRYAEDAQVTYSYWSPNDGFNRIATTTCDLYQKGATNTLFILDYASTLNGWTIVGTKPNPPNAPALETIRGPAHTSIMTMFPNLDEPETYKFFIVYQNTITDETLERDPQEGNKP
jgi:hypothetical protein